MKYTFGKTLAAQRLELLLQDNPSARRKISRIFSSYTSKLLKIAEAKDAETVRLCMEMLRDYTLRRIDVTKNLTDNMRTHAKNVIIYRYRVYRRNFNSLVPFISKKNEGLTSGNELI